MKQIEKSQIRWIDKSDIYETKYIDNLKPLIKMKKENKRDICK